MRLICSSLILMTGILIAGCDNSQNTPNDTSSELAICRSNGDGTFTLSSDDPDAFSSHLLEGDGIPTGPVPRQAGFVFSADCMPVADTDAGPCPAGMAHVDDFCIDRWEAHLENQSPYDVPTDGIARATPGMVPQGYISGTVAARACEAAGKRLCSSREWVRACQGPNENTFPYGNAYAPGACNEGREAHPVVELFGNATDWSPGQMNDPRINQLPDGLKAAGSYPACMSVEGVYDMHGNLHEWVADADGTFRGGFYVDAEINGAGCSYRTTAHGRDYHDYSTGFRCCAEAR